MSCDIMLDVVLNCCVNYLFKDIIDLGEYFCVVSWVFVSEVVELLVFFY